MEDMQGGPDYIVLRNFDIDSIRTISSVLGQSIALDYFVSQVSNQVITFFFLGVNMKLCILSYNFTCFVFKKVDGMIEEFTYINRVMEKTGTFTMDRKKLFQLVGKANSNLADVILRVGIFDR